MAKVQRICQRCGNEFWVLESWLAWDTTRGKFCSSECYTQNRKEKSERLVTCLECGKEFKTQRHFFNRGEAKFCSHSCSASHSNRVRSDRPSQELLEQMYVQEKRSMQEIADALGCSPNKVGYWMDQYGIKRRSQSDATYVKRNPNGDPFKLKDLTTPFDHELFTTAIALYIGEGTKDRNDVSLANSNPQVIRTFLRFLREICGVEEYKIHAWLNVFDDVDVDRVLSYWQNVTKLPIGQFGKPTVRASRGGSYLKKSEFGTLTITVPNSKLAEKINKWCNDTLEKFS